MDKKNKLLLVVIFSSLLFNCGSKPVVKEPRPSPSRFVKFTPKQDEITTTKSLKDYLSFNSNPKIVLRTSSQLNSDNITEQEKNNYLYNAIESELLKNGFKVRDRQLFEKVLANSENYKDYEKLKEISDTDLIIELTNLDRSIAYSTNKYYDSNGREGTSNVLSHRTFYGATIEFKVVMISSNELAGIYKFNYVPCVYGCEYTGVSLPKSEVESYEAVEEDDLIKFVIGATKKLVNEMRN